MPFGATPVCPCSHKSQKTNTRHLDSRLFHELRRWRSRLWTKENAARLRIDPRRTKTQKIDELEPLLPARIATEVYRRRGVETLQPETLRSS